MYEKYPEFEKLAKETQHAWSPGFLVLVFLASLNNLCLRNSNIIVYLAVGNPIKQLFDLFGVVNFN